MCTLALYVTVAGTPTALVGLGEQETDGGTGLLTDTAVHAPQLLDSFVSSMTPLLLEELLSAHARTYQGELPFVDEKVYERVAENVLAEESDEERVYVPISVAPLPEEFVARWKSTVNPPMVATEPVFEMVEESVTGCPTVADVGVMLPAVRSGSDCMETLQVAFTV